MYLDYAEEQAERHIPMTMDMIGKVNQGFYNLMKERYQIIPKKYLIRQIKVLHFLNLKNIELFMINYLNLTLINL